MKKEYPILEFDLSEKAIINASEHIKNIAPPENCVLCFFGEVVRKVCQEHKAEVVKRFRWECGTFTLFKALYNKEPFAFMHCGVGAPQAASHIEELSATGCTSFIACGGAGVLDSSKKVGHIVVPYSAIRDEGTSYHYLSPSRTVEADSSVVNAICKTLDSLSVEYEKAITWTTDAPYRETKEKISLRKAEGALTVEMECAAFMAVAKFRNVKFGQLLYCGDDVSGEKWDVRGWHKKASLREKLFWLAVECSFNI